MVILLQKWVAAIQTGRGQPFSTAGRERGYTTKEPNKVAADK
jgi:hypothetical protein